MSIGAVRDWSILRCPSCQAKLDGTDTSQQCTGCAQTWPVRDGVPALFRDSWVRGNDRLMRHIYDALPSLHDPAVTYMLPLWQLEGSEGAMRNRYLCRVELEKLGPRADGRPLRILEVCIGTGVNRRLVEQWLPKGLQVDYWGADLSEGMMAVCKKKLAKQGFSDVQLVMADAHALPFADASFDRVFHVGAIGNFSDPGQAMREMARVAEPGTPIVVVDEQLERDRSHNLWVRAWFKALTFYDSNPHCPTEAVPPGAWDVLEEQLGRFYYGLRFRVGAAPTDIAAERAVDPAPAATPVQRPRSRGKASSPAG